MSQRGMSFLDLALELRFMVYEEYMLDNGIEYEVYGESDTKDPARLQHRIPPLCAVCDVIRVEYEEVMKKLMQRSAVTHHFKLALPNAMGRYGNIWDELPIRNILSYTIAADLSQQCTSRTSVRNGRQNSVRVYEPLLIDRCGLEKILATISSAHSVTIDFTNAPSEGHSVMDLPRSIVTWTLCRNMRREMALFKGLGETLPFSARMNRGRELKRIKITVDEVVKVDWWRELEGDWVTGKEIWRKCTDSSGRILEVYDQAWTYATDHQC